MSYYLYGYRTGSSAADFERVLGGIVPQRLHADVLRIDHDPVVAAVFGTKRAIPDRVLRDRKTGSWIVLIGTPVGLGPGAEDDDLVSRFLDDPARFLRLRLDGNFALFAYDAPRDRCFAATDFNSTIPVFYSHTNGGVLFSSHELPLARHLRAEIDPFGFAQAIQLGVTWGESTRFRGIAKLLPCQLAVADGTGKFRISRYWRPRDESRWSGSFREQRDLWGGLLREAVWRFYDAADRKPVLSDFTAGEDARLIVAQCHALGIPFKAHVAGSAGDADVIIGKLAARYAGFDLLVREKKGIDEELLLTDALEIVLANDAYLEFFKACSEYATDAALPLDDFSTVKYCGVPGGEAFRGSYYLRGKALFPSLQMRMDHRFFTRMKYLLDYRRGLLRQSDDTFLAGIEDMVRAELKEVAGFPVGTQIDHLLRVFQTSFAGLKYRTPLYLPLATSRLTRSVYGLNPRFKQGGRLTKACTELLFPELARVRTQNGAPTITRTLARLPLFLPEYLSVVRKAGSGAISRLLKWRQANKWYYSLDFNGRVFTTLLNAPPYRAWFASSRGMLTGSLYDPASVDPILNQARAGTCRYVPILGRVIANELACRWVHRDGL